MAPRNRLSQFLIKNLLLALLSLLLGFISWSYLSNKVESEKRITLPLEYKIPTGSNFAPQPAIEVLKDGVAKPLDKIEVEVRIRGLKDKISSLDERALKLQFTVNPDRDVYPDFQVDPAKMLSGADGLTAQVVTPQMYHLNFARQFATQVTTRLEYNREAFEPRGAYYDDWVVRGYSLVPDRVTVTGAEDALQIPADHHLFLSTRKVTLEPEDVKAGVWKKSGKVELADQVEELDAQNQHVKWVPVRAEAAEVAYEVTVETRPETGTVRIPLQVLPPVDRLKMGATDAFDTYVLADGSPREITVQYQKPRRSPAVMDSTQIFAFVNVTAPGNLSNLPINLYSVYLGNADLRIKIWLAAEADGSAPHA
ncbi:MAG TPA: hypothetical protein VL860_10460, partial [Planctomycetota bacterium]|nr:hypothetical protein [Planctomycetota bacterium]